MVCPGCLGDFRLGGTAENSPAIHRWERDGGHHPVPEGRLKPRHSAVPPGLGNRSPAFPAMNRWAILVLSLRDGTGKDFPDRPLTIARPGSSRPSIFTA